MIALQPAGNRLRFQGQQAPVSNQSLARSSGQQHPVASKKLGQPSGRSQDRLGRDVNQQRIREELILRPGHPLHTRCGETIQHRSAQLKGGRPVQQVTTDLAGPSLRSRGSPLTSTTKL